MTSKLRLLPLIALAFAALAFAACGGSRENAGPPTTEPAAANVDAGANNDLFVSNGIEVLGRSSSAFASTDVHSFTGETNFSFQLGATKMSELSTFASQDPDMFYMDMSLDSGETLSLFGDFGSMKMLARDGTFYMNLFGGWMSFTPEDLGADQADIEKLMDSGSIFDYSNFVKNTASVTFIGDEDVNGHSTARYKFQGTVGELFSAFSDASGGSAIEGELPGDGANLPVTIDLWIGKDDFLPYKLAMTAADNTAQGHMELTGLATFDNYNQPVSIPEAPDDAVSMAEFFAGMFSTETPAP
jgi:hypothetical protein